MKNEPTPKSNSVAETLSPAARDFSRVIAAELVKCWQQERQAQTPESDNISHSSLHRPSYRP